MGYMLIQIPLFYVDKLQSFHRLATKNVENRGHFVNLYL